MRTSFWTKLLDLISPRLCASCGTRLSAEEVALCSHCLLHLPFPDTFTPPISGLLAHFFWGQFPVERAAALFLYTPQSKVAHILYRMKYGNEPELARSMGVIMARKMQECDFFSGIDGLVPVPLSVRRRWQRGYNQSEEMARGISDVTGLPIYNKVLARKTFRDSQTGLSVYQRRDNVAQAFRLKNAQQAAGKHLLIIDDVVTTGSTVTACARQLMLAGGVRLSVLALGFSKS